MDILVCYVTHPDEASAKRISDFLLEKRVIACANLFPVSSAYGWLGEKVHETEWVSIFKTRIALEKEVEAAVLTLHPYQTPCILRFEARVNEAYFNWICESTQGF